MTVQPASERLSRHAREWQVEVERTRTTETSILAFGRRAGQPVVLKVLRAPGEEWKSGELLAAFEGHGLINALEHADGAVLLKRLTPGHDLTALCRGGGDAEATAVIAGIIDQMATRRPALAPAMSLQSMASGFDRYRHNCDGLITADLVTEAEQLYAHLCDTQKDARVLHGDLHHYNVLFDAEYGWVAIDPWGVIGEVEFEVGASLRNPYALEDLITSRETLETRLRIYGKLLAIDLHRALQWAFAQTVLAALWPTEEGIGTDLRRPFVMAAMTMRGVLG